MRPGTTVAALADAAGEQLQVDVKPSWRALMETVYVPWLPSTFATILVPVCVPS